ncbi:MAG: methionyl-tRNA formyltransferase [Patescibacteria group bacterium]|nr:MAG: methionyl-tRNA formyltransferase [Patescibacteria group bacterium]
MPREPYNIVFFGTSDFAVPVLQHLQTDGSFSILQVVTQPDRPVGRKHVLTAPPVKRAALELGLSIVQPESLRGHEAESHFKNLNADAYVVVSYGKILPKRLLELPKYGGINVHASLLPAYRGASPISAAINAGDKETGVTIMVMDEKMDEGPVLDYARMPISEEDTTATLTHKLSELGADIIAPTLKAYFAGALSPQAQDNAKASYSGILTREDGRIDWSKSAVEIERFVRAMQPWPEAFTFWTRGGKAQKLTIKKASVLHPSAPCDAAGNTSVACKLADGTLAVNCGTGSLLLKTIQLEGKNETDAKAFLNGHPDFIGSQLIYTL